MSEPLDIHLDPGEMSRLVRLDCSHELAFEWLAHLVACELCRTRLTEHFPAESRRILDRFLRLHDQRSHVELHPNAYDKVFERARERAHGRVLRSSVTVPVPATGPAPAAPRERTSPSGAWNP